MSLLQKRYATQNAHALQLVPDQHQGDLGLEAFSHNGYAYQCYAAEEPLSTAQLYDKQRDKLTTDLGKLRDRSREVSSLLGPVIIHRYVFMVHRNASRHLIAHGHSKADDVRSWNLPFVHDSFSIVIETAADYAVEREAIHALPSPVIEAEDLTEDFTRTWQGSNPTLQGRALGKLSRVTGNSETQNAVLDALTQQYLIGENALERLKEITPETHRAILRARAHRERLLVLEHPASQNRSHETLSVIAGKLTETLSRDFPTLSTQMAEVFAWATVADWLMRCPLDFGAINDGD